MTPTVLPKCNNLCHLEPCSEEIPVPSFPQEFVLGPQDREAMAHCLLNLWLEGWVLRKEVGVRICAYLDVLIHILHLLCGKPPSAHEARGTSRHFTEFIQMVANIFDLIQHIKGFLDPIKFGAYF